MTTDDPQDGGGDGQRPPWLDPTAEVGAGAAGGLVGAVIAGPVGGAVGGAAGPALLRAFNWIEGRWSQRSRRNGCAVLELAAQEIGETPEQLAARVDADPRRLQLAGMAINAGMMTADAEKIRALARALAAAATDDALVDPQLLAVAALTDMEAPHVKVLRFMGEPQMGGRTMNGRYYYGSWPKAGLAHAVPGIGSLIDPVLSTLTRHALVSEKTDLQHSIEERLHVTDRGPRQWRPPTPEYKITEFGEHCLHLLEAVLDENQGASEDDQRDPGQDGRWPTDDE